MKVHCHGSFSVPYAIKAVFVGPCHHGMACPQVADGGTADKGWSSSLGVGQGANNSSPWKTKCYEILIGEVLPLETKQSGGKLLSHSDLPGGGVFLEEASRNRDIL